MSWKAGYISQYFSTALCASTMSIHIWQRAALKKYSLALYLSNELSIASAATYKLQPKCDFNTQNIINRIITIIYTMLSLYILYVNLVLRSEWLQPRLICLKGKGKSNKFVQICNYCLCGQVEIKVDYKVRDQVLKSIRLGWVSVLEGGVISEILAGQVSIRNWVVWLLFFLRIF